MPCRFVLHHILITTKWTCPPGLQDKWLNCLLRLICLTNTVGFLLVSRAASKAGFRECIHSSLLLRELPSLTFQTVDRDGLSCNVFWFLFAFSGWSPRSRHAHSAPWQDTCVFFSRWLKISDMFLSWILPWQLETALTSIAKYAFF